MQNLINKILSSYSSAPSAWELSPKGKEQWIKEFFNKLDLSHVPLKELLGKLKDFYQTEMKEEDFSKIFASGTKKAYKYQSPLDYSKQLKTEEISKIALKLSLELGIDYGPCFLLLKRIYQLYPSSQWNAETFLMLLGSYDPELKASLTIEQAAA